MILNWIHLQRPYFQRWLNSQILWFRISTDLIFEGANNKNFYQIQIQGFWGSLWAKGISWSPGSPKDSSASMSLLHSVIGSELSVGMLTSVPACDEFQGMAVGLWISHPHGYHRYLFLDLCIFEHL